MASDRYGAATGADIAAQASATAYAYPAPADDQQAVPSGQDRPKTETRKLGDGWVAGTLVADPSIKFTDAGKAMVLLRIAENVRIVNADTRKWEDGYTRYADITVWEAQGESCADQLRKGDRIVAVGEWQARRWFGNDGQWHTRRTLTARDIGPSMRFTPARVIRPTEEND